MGDQGMTGLLLILPALACALSLALNVLAMSFVQIAVSFMVCLIAFGLLADPGVVLFGRGLFVLDPVNSVILITVSVLEFLVALYAFGYIRSEVGRGLSKRKFKLYYFWKNLFILSMMVSVLANNLGIYWIGLEATTLATVFLVAFYRNRESYEASWKYVITCSTGIAIGLFAVVVLYFSTSGIYGDSMKALSFYDILAAVDGLDKNLLILAFILAVVGFGTKAGLAPMHGWLPDAHSHAPSPVSSLLSGVLLNVALLGVLRFYQINLKAGNETVRYFLLFFGILTLLFASISTLKQKEYKRLFAYSSMEHMGLITLGIGFGGISVLGAVLHILFHAINKGILFLSAGNILAVFYQKEMRRVKGLLKSMPATATMLILGTAGISGVPPFSIFLSKFFILLGVFRVNLWAGVLILILVALVFTGMLYQVLSMLLGESAEKKEGDIHALMVYAPMLMLFISIAMLFYLPHQFVNVLDLAVHELGGVSK